MRGSILVAGGALVLGGTLAVRAIAQQGDDDGPDRLALVSVLDGHRIDLHQHDDRPGGGCITSHTRLELCFREGGGQLPPGPCRGGPIEVRVEAHDEAAAHAAGLLGALGVLAGQNVDGILGGLRQSGFDIESMTLVRAPRVPPAIPPGPPIVPQLVDLVSSALVADRPGGGCIQVQPLFTTGAAALNLGGSCGFSPLQPPPHN